ncbi:D-Ala-D-Ala carboxypeptidase family metallohydrolase [Simiduia sp. 21SJ11W-1]|uniref:D-Ala-D-Ala carboxypeptidase family metallohydrolase n=1 Tax=Simiduia sp. 21SJ11W-1 TaxID=2909669 RepID=UPI00209F4D15|nr:D-Ala-D-Ala carboxypeptidase family metallohydrolase [Simiduia sp. 21SJ11W-1]UTA47865.1 D-Ala-D-Ala carboxypeptidase family metallohydrolase [Simiduia sp. 21SJ11W-1]
MGKRGFLIFVFSACVSLAEKSAAAFDPMFAPFKVAVNTRNIDHSVDFQPVMPGQALSFTFDDDASYRLTVGAVEIQSQARKITWLAPAKAGHLPAIIRRDGAEAAIQLQIFVLEPATHIKQGKLNGYRIGEYPPARHGLKSYAAPTGYIEVQSSMLQLPVSPHFTLGQFLCKQASGYPKYLVLRPRLLQKLELLLQDLNQEGIATDGLVVMSGYRTPFYNRSIGNVSASRHLYGGAADVYVDVLPKNGVMDDLNGDGKVNLADATYLYERADKLVKNTGRQDLVGGVGRYGANSAHGPFVHVDVRGEAARWGH